MTIPTPAFHGMKESELLALGDCYQIDDYIENPKQPCIYELYHIDQRHFTKYVVMRKPWRMPNKPYNYCRSNKDVLDCTYLKEKGGIDVLACSADLDP
jgi:hypothetical protein